MNKRPLKRKQLSVSRDTLYGVYETNHGVDTGSDERRPWERCIPCLIK